MGVSSLLQMTDQCVKCGLCLPSCPTYQLSRQESESPRGRIAIIEALAKQEFSPSKTAQLHLQHCLSCRTCEVVCPAKVPFHEIMDQGRALIQSQAPRVWRLDILLPILLRSRFLQSIVQVGLFLLQRIGFLSRLPRCGWLRWWPEKISPHRGDQDEVYLLRGCLHTLFDTQTLTSAIDLLSACDYQVRFPKSAYCCGGLDQASGRQAAAKKFTQQNNQVFKKNIPITATASGCLLTLIGSAQPFRQRVQDIHTLLLPKLQQKTFAPLNQSVALHLPCSQKNGLQNSDVIIALLRLIPKLKLHILQNRNCCGGSGDYFLRFPQLADQLAQPIIEQCHTLDIQILLTSNIGCSIHLQQQLDCDLQIMHPLTLLKQQLTPLHAKRV